MCVLMKEGQIQVDWTAVHRDWLVGEELGSQVGWVEGRQGCNGLGLGLGSKV